MQKQLSDRVFVDEELEGWATSPQWMSEGGIYENYDSRCVRGDSYDIRAGDLIIVGQVEGRQHISLKDQKEIFIEPFQSASLQSFEKIKLPRDMCGDLWIRNALQHRGLAYTGGGIDPGYWGHFYIKIHNVGPTKVSIKYKQHVASIRLTKMHREAKKSYTDSEIVEPHKEQLPPLPPRVVYDWLNLSGKLDSLRSDVDHIKSIHDKFIIGSVSGLIVGLILILVQIMLRLGPN